MVSRLKEQLDAVRRETSNWPEWRKQEIEAEVLKTPLKSRPGKPFSGQPAAGGSGGVGRPTEN
jgi:hypothetical protein